MLYKFIPCLYQTISKTAQRQCDYFELMKFFNRLTPFGRSYGLYLIQRILFSMSCGFIPDRVILFSMLFKKFANWLLQPFNLLNPIIPPPMNEPSQKSPFPSFC